MVLKEITMHMYFILHRYSIDHHTNRDKLFYIDPIDGSITALQPLDRELSKWHNISVLATEISEFFSLNRLKNMSRAAVN